MELDFELFPNELAVVDKSAREMLLSHASGFLDTMLDYKDLLLGYSGALRTL